MFAKLNIGEKNKQNIENQLKSPMKFPATAPGFRFSIVTFLLIFAADASTEFILRNAGLRLTRAKIK